MTYNHLHKYQYELTKVLNNQFNKQLLGISSNAYLCYQGHHQKFTVSLFELNEDIEAKPQLNVVSKKVETEHVLLISEYTIDYKVEQLVRDLTKFVMNEGPINDNSINPTT